SIIGLSQVKKEDISKFGVAEGVKLDEKNLKIKNIIEKPSPDKAPSDLVVVGKYIITPGVFKTLSKMSQEKSGEIGLSHVFEIMLSNNRPVYGHILEGDWLDTGDKFNFVKATIHLGRKHPEIKDKLEQYLKSLKK
ncbi:MAG TPA: UTP--glucose-1-phosphate uridylyltransferase, partial [Candidatus Moranbacteria bacterium]|nr:UTP--glucose-1-phosphate uridylyltransferase [Candidatus Moranbacteria bacterium]